MGICKDCKWWGEYADYDVNGKRECGMTVQWYDHNTQSDTLLHPETKAMVNPDDGVSPNGLWTMPDFGCIQFAAKD